MPTGDNQLEELDAIASLQATDEFLVNDVSDLTDDAGGTAKRCLLSTLIGGTDGQVLYSSGGVAAGFGTWDGSALTVPGEGIIQPATYTNTSGSTSVFSITPTYNQASGTAANTDLLVNRTETMVGSGTQNLIDLQVGGTSRFNIDNVGRVGVNIAAATAMVKVKGATSAVGMIIENAATTPGHFLSLNSSGGSDGDTFRIESTGDIRLSSATSTRSVYLGSATNRMVNWTSNGLNVDWYAGAGYAHKFGFGGDFSFLINVDKSVIVTSTNSNPDAGFVINPLTGGERVLQAGRLWNENVKTIRFRTQDAFTNIAGNYNGGNIIFQTGAGVGTGVPGRLIFEITAGAEKMRITTEGAGFGVTSPTARLHLGGNESKAAWGLTGVQYAADATTYTDSSTAGSGTATNAVFTSFGQPTLAATNASVTTTNSATCYIAGPPLAGTNQTLTTRASLWLAGTLTNTAGTSYGIRIAPTYNQASGTGANTDLLVNRTETAVGSGTQRLLDLQVGGTSLFNVSNVATATLTAAQATLTVVSTTNGNEGILNLGGKSSGGTARTGQIAYVAGGGATTTWFAIRANNDTLADAFKVLYNGNVDIPIGSLTVKTTLTALDDLKIGGASTTPKFDFSNASVQITAMALTSGATPTMNYYASKMSIDSVGKVGINKATSIGAMLHIVETTSSVGLIVEAAATTPGNLIECNTSGGSGGDLAKVDSVGLLSAKNFRHFGTDNIAIDSINDSFAAWTNGIRNIGIGKEVLKALTSGSLNVAIGNFTATVGNPNQSVFIGYNTGLYAGASTTRCTVVGYQCNVWNTSDNILLGHGSDSSSNSNHFVAGSNSSTISNVFFGNGITNATPAAYTINGTGGSGTDIAGAALQLAGGKATGNAAGGSIVFQTSDAGGTGTTLQTLTTKATLTAAGKVGINDTSPDAMLDIVQTTSAVGLIVEAAATTPGNLIECNTSGGSGGDLVLVNSSGVFGGLDNGIAASASAWGLAGVQYDGKAVTYTDSSTAGSGTATNAVFTSFGQPTLAATNLTVTTTNSATCYIAGPPLAGTNQTLTTRANLWLGGTLTNTAGTSYGIRIAPTYNQASGTGANTDLLVNRTETAVGSGTQRLLDLQVGGTTKFNVDNTGKITFGFVATNDDCFIERSGANMIIANNSNFNGKIIFQGDVGGTNNVVKAVFGQNYGYIANLRIGEEVSGYFEGKLENTTIGVLTGYGGLRLKTRDAVGVYQEALFCRPGHTGGNHQVGINVAAPTGQLHVKGRTSQIACVIENAATTPGNLLELNTSGGSGGDLVLVQSDGDTGIGCTPNEKLQVDDAIAVSNDAEGSTARMTIRTARESVTLSGATTDTSLAIPSGARLLAASFNVDTAITFGGGGATWDAAFNGGSSTSLASAKAATQNTKEDTQVVDEIASATTEVRFSPDVGTFTAGVIEVVIYYIELTSLANA